MLKVWVPKVQHQLCITHKVRAMLRHLAYENLSTQDAQEQTLSPTEAKKLRSSEIQADAYDIYKTDDWMEAIERLVTFVGTWKPVEPHAVRTFLKNIALTFSFYDLDNSLFVLIRTPNALERLFREGRAKTDEIGAFPNEDSCLTLFFLVIQRDHAKHPHSLFPRTCPPTTAQMLDSKFLPQSRSTLSGERSSQTFEPPFCPTIRLYRPQSRP